MVVQFKVNADVRNCDYKSTSINDVRTNECYESRTEVRIVYKYYCTYSVQVLLGEDLIMIYIHQNELEATLTLGDIVYVYMYIFDIG